MNFSHFGGNISPNLPALHQFAAKFSPENVCNVFCSTTDNSRYTANRMPSFTHHHPATQHQLVNAGKCHQNYINSNYIQNNNHSSVRLLDKHLLNYDQQELTQELCAAVLQQQENNQANTKVPQEQSSSSTPRILQQSNQETFSISNNSTIAQSWHSALTSTSTVADYLSNLPASTLPLSLQHFLKYSAENLKKDSINYSNSQNNNLLLQGGQTNSNTVNVVSGNTSNNNHNILTTGNNYQSSINLNTINTAYLHTHMAIKKKKKKKIEKEKKPRPKPGEIRLTTALDGSTLYCCPECHMAYPEKELLEQHIVGHTMERRFVCDICGAGLKRKDHLTRHKQSHNPERPFVCTVCLKAFKRKEQLTLHFVIHSGEKRHICSECGKGFYRKDHLRKHTRSHIARRVKAELSQHGNGEGIDNINLHIVSTATVRDANNGLQLG